MGVRKPLGPTAGPRSVMRLAAVFSHLSIGAVVQDLVFVLLTVLFFALLALVVRGVEKL